VEDNEKSKSIEGIADALDHIEDEIRQDSMEFDSLNLEDINLDMLDLDSLGIGKERTNPDSFEEKEEYSVGEQEEYSFEDMIPSPAEEKEYFPEDALSQEKEHFYEDAADDEMLEFDPSLLDLIPDLEEREADEEEQSKEAAEESIEIVSNKAGKREKKKTAGIFSKLFGNVKEERTSEQVEQLKREAIEGVEAREQAQIEKKAEQEKKKAEKEKKKKEDQAKKKADQAAKQKKKQELVKQKAAAKKAAKDKKAQEIQNLVDEIDANEGRINRVGAAIVFSLFAIFGIVFVLGTNSFSYSLNIRNARANFQRQRYNEAYEQVYGLEIKDEDIQTYDRIMTVMFVNKQLNSYENYYELGEYAKALDSLIKGIRRYEKYNTLATMLGIEKDMDYVRDQIYAKLYGSYGIAQKEAEKLVHIEDAAEYSAAIYEYINDGSDGKFSKE